MKSGIDLLNELIDQVKLLNKRYEVIEQNVKMLLARSNGQAPQAVLANHAPATIKPTIAPPQQQQAPKPQVKKTIANSNHTRVIGKIKDNEGKVLGGVEIKVYDANNNIVKQTKTNRAGDWMCFLPPGQYAANYFLEGQVNGNATFSVSSDEKIVRVGQPSF